MRGKYSARTQRKKEKEKSIFRFGFVVKMEITITGDRVYPGETGIKTSRTNCSLHNCSIRGGHFPPPLSSSAPLIRVNNNRVTSLWFYILTDSAHTRRLHSILFPRAGRTRGSSHEIPWNESSQFRSNLERRKKKKRGPFSGSTQSPLKWLESNRSSLLRCCK